MTARKNTAKRNSTGRDLAGHNGFSLISEQQLRAFYKGLLECRALEEYMRGADKRAVRLHPERYAAAVVCAMDLRREDRMVAPTGTLIFPFLKKVPLKQLSSESFAEWRLEQPVAAKPAGFINAACHAALRDRMQGEENLVVAFAAAHAEDTEVAEALRFAVEQKLPVLFVFFQTAQKPAKKNLAVAVPEFPRILVDGEDAVALYRAVSESVSRIRRGFGPTLIECIAFPGADPEVRGPIAKMEAYLRRKQLYSASYRNRTLAALAARLAVAIPDHGASIQIVR